MYDQLQLAVLSGNIKKLYMLLKSYMENKNAEKIIEECIDKALDIAIVHEQWESILLLLAVKKNPLFKGQLKILSKHKEAIFSVKNLKCDYLPATALRDALNNCNNLGVLAYPESDLLCVLGSLAPSMISGPLSRIHAEFETRKKAGELEEKLGKTQKSILDQFTIIVAIDNDHRSYQAWQLAQEFLEDLRIWLLKSSRIAVSQVIPIYEIIQTILLLADKGFTEVKGKKHKYSMLIPTKIHFNSIKINKKNKAHYNKKHGVHLATSDLSIVVHELVHKQCQFIFGSTTPNPPTEWAALAKVIQQDLAKFKEKVPEKYQGLDYFSSYDESKYAEELPPRLFEFYMKNFTLPKNTSVLSSKTIAEINRLFGGFYKEEALIEKLIEDYKADVNIRDKNNKCAVEYAMEAQLDFKTVGYIASKMNKTDPIITKVKEYEKLAAPPGEDDHITSSSFTSPSP